MGRLKQLAISEAEIKGLEEDIDFLEHQMYSIQREIDEKKVLIKQRVYEAIEGGRMRYVWVHKQTGLKIEVDRPMKDSDIPPTEDELREEGLYEEEFLDVVNWSRFITGGSFTKGFGQKGNW